jgi:hypothetical protein
MTMNPIKHHAPLGAIIGGTHRLADLVPCFAEVLEKLARKNGMLEWQQPILSRARQIIRDKNWDGEDAVAVHDELVEALDDFSPPYARFGTHEGDGASFGFWLDDIDQIAVVITDLMSGMVVGDLSEVPERFNGEVLVINDHGNASLYVSARGKLRCIWSIV